MNFKGVELCCPHCRGELERPEENLLVCRGCARKFPILAGIPDLRISVDTYLTLEQDYERVRKLEEKFNELNFEGMVDYYYSLSTAVPPRYKRAYKRGLLAGLGRARAWLESWEAAAASPPGGRLLEIGCGTAPLLVAAEKYPMRVGVDIALRSLVMGRRQLADAGMEAPLICACAEALPIREGQFDCVVSDSTLELLSDQKKALAEAQRMLVPGGRIFVATPNRFSLGPDPHTKIIGGTWLPQKWTDAIMLRQGGLVPFRRLFSKGALRRALRQAGFTDVKIYLPTFPKEQSALFSAAMRAAVALYHLFLKLPVAKQLMTIFGPVYLAVGKKR